MITLYQFLVEGGMGEHMHHSSTSMGKSRQKMVV